MRWPTNGTTPSKGPTTRAMTIRIQEEWDPTTPRGDILLYIFEDSWRSCKNYNGILIPFKNNLVQVV